MKKKTRKPSVLFNIAECKTKNGYRYLLFKQTSCRTAFTTKKHIKKVAKWFAQAGKWLDEK